MNPFVGLWSKKRILRKGRLTTCLVLIALVMAALDSALIFSESMMNGVVKKYIYLSSGHILVYQTSSSDIDIDSSMCLYKSSTCTGNALMYSSKGTSSLSIKGVDSNYFNNDRLKQIDIEYYSGENQSKLHGVIISKSTAKKLNVKNGDKVAIMVVPDTSASVVRPVMMYVSGIFTTGYDTLDSYFCFTDYEFAKLLYPGINSVNTEVIVTPEYENNLGTVMKAINNNGDYESSSWYSMNKTVYSNFSTSKQMIMIILVLVVIIAAFFTSSTAQQMISDDMKEIALSKLIGASDKQIQASALISVYSVTLIGIAAGTLLSFAICYLFDPFLKYLSHSSIEAFSYYLLDFDIQIPFASIIEITLTMIVISFITIRISLSKTKHISPMQLFTTT